MRKSIQETIAASIQVKQAVLNSSTHMNCIEDIAKACIQAYKTDNKVLLCGNGGSAADAQHIAAELSGRFYKDRSPLFAEALHVNSSYITAVANDYGFDAVYARLVEAFGRPGDILIGLSTSGNSANVVQAH